MLVEFKCTRFHTGGAVKIITTEGVEERILKAIGTTFPSVTIKFRYLGSKLQTLLFLINSKMTEEAGAVAPLL